MLLFFAGLEWARLCRLAGTSRWALAATLALVFVVTDYLELQQALFLVACAWWIVLAPAWMWRGVRPDQQTWLGAAGFAVLVPAGLAMAALGPLEVLLVLVLVWIADTAA